MQDGFIASLISTYQGAYKANVHDHQE